MCAHIIVARVSHNVCLKASESDEKINTEKLKQRDKIHFYADIVLYEDELSDHGCSLLNVKIVNSLSCTILMLVPSMVTGN